MTFCSLQSDLGPVKVPCMWSVTYVVFSWTMMAEVPLIAMDYQDLQGER